ncbi:uncharacterized protein LOC118425434 [Branchiostoma floridae]|uniref:Uncharacterized protein LOC118425434 n=1 Tax=Branchiostoma floridae TaxID=7739 RepID=C3YVX6_BRAFL|nr:uncharacterized protein LOC118425434 [Branchiostoma floridae]|eukprot:XP_002599528.1 hypothetical protein BRAFLDRAFT_77631 [Branchiostoma floridae]
MLVIARACFLLLLCLSQAVHATPPVQNANRDISPRYHRPPHVLLAGSHGHHSTVTNISRSRGTRNHDRGLQKPNLMLNLNLLKGQVSASVDTTFRSLSCDVTVWCKGGKENSCSCGEDRLRTCALPMARITHKSWAQYDPMTLFCVGVELASAQNGTNYELLTRCKTRGVGKVKYRVYVKREDKNAALNEAQPTVRYRACLEPLQD